MSKVNPVIQKNLFTTFKPKQVLLSEEGTDGMVHYPSKIKGLVPGEFSLPLLLPIVEMHVRSQAKASFDRDGDRNNNEHDGDEKFLFLLLHVILEKIPDVDFGPAQLYKEMAMSSSKLHRELKEVTDMTPSQIIRHCRLMTGRYLLLTSTASVADIALECGFKDPAYFTRSFTKEVGVNPTEFRRQLKRHKANDHMPVQEKLPHQEEGFLKGVHNERSHLVILALYFCFWTLF